MRNFACPYFARDIAEFWRRWHISLTTWFRDYVYIPLGGSKCGVLRGLRNVFVIFLLSGLWHGANWTFVCWGVFHAMLFLPLFIFGLNRRYVQDENECGGSMGCKGWIQIALTVFFVVVGWTFFRAQTFKESIVWMSNMFNPLTYASVKELPREFFVSILFSCVMFGIEWLNRREPFGFSLLPNNVVLRRGLYYIIIALIIIFTPGSETFVYFQF
jgi:D-alanyl-lipoteichoic acid acyltransferase DltB (MBOAT superfamily)